MSKIIESKDFAKELRKAIKENFPTCKFSVKTKDQTININWYDINYDEFTGVIENFLNENGKENYINIKCIEVWREFTREFMNNNKDWNRERRMKTIKWVNKLDRPNTENKMIADIANVIYQNKKVNVIFSNKDQSNTITFDYKKSWSHKKYIDKAMEQAGIEPNFGFHYGWDMTAI
jgi:hypothetical protein